MARTNRHNSTGRGADALYERMLRAGAVDRRMQQRVFAYAKRAGATSLLVELTRIDGLDPAIDAALGEISEARVRAAWLARPGRDLGTVVDAIAGERRVTVLVELAVREDLPEDAYRTLAGRANNKIARALILNPVVTPAVRTQAAARWAATSRPNPSWADKTRFTETLKAHPELASTVACSASEATWLYELVAAYTLEPDAAGAVIDALPAVAKATITESERGNHIYGGRFAINSGITQLNRIVGGLISNRSLRPSQAQSLKTQGVAAVAILADAGAGMGFGKDELAGLQTVLSGLPGSYGDAPAATPAVSLADLGADSVAGAVTTAVAAGDKNACVQLLLNPNITPEQAAALARSCSWASRAAVLDATRNRPDIWVEVLASYSHMISDEMLGRASDPPAVFAKLLSRVRNSPRALSNLAGSRYMTRDALAGLPLAVLANTEASPQLFQMLAEHLESEVGDDDELWAYVEGLMDGFDGSVSELLDTARHVLV